MIDFKASVRRCSPYSARRPTAAGKHLLLAIGCGRASPLLGFDTPAQSLSSEHAPGAARFKIIHAIHVVRQARSGFSMSLTNILAWVLCIFSYLHLQLLSSTVLKEWYTGRTPSRGNRCWMTDWPR